MILSKIIEGCRIVSLEGRTDMEVLSVCSDSRKVELGSMFIAVRGFAVNGHDFIDGALAKGACAIVYDDPSAIVSMAEGVTYIRVESSRSALGTIASNFYDRPSEKLTLVGITGTNGKTTTVTLLYRLFTRLGYNCGLLSTIANYVGSKGTEAVNTTSDPLTINSLMSQMVEEGCQWCFMEVSSIGVEQERIAGLKFKAGIFSNLTHDHLDYHKTFAEYLRCKKLFFDNLPSDAFAIVNVDDRTGEVMVQNPRAQKVSYSLRGMADHTCRVMEMSFDGMLLKLDSTETWCRLTGTYNAYNLLAIYTTAVVLGADKDEVLLALSTLGPAPGRLENMKGPKDISIIIDYAHTPDALENVLKTLREIAPDRELVCLFGCGGDRDRTKRPEMGSIAQKYADRVIVTSDNSRSERTADIMADIKTGMDTKGRAKSLFIEDRAEAIRTAVAVATPGATILLAGKGHETYQIIGSEKRHFDEKEIVAQINKEYEQQ